jgi:hypothetical protein
MREAARIPGRSAPWRRMAFGTALLAACLLTESASPTAALDQPVAPIAEATRARSLDDFAPAAGAGREAAPAGGWEAAPAEGVMLALSPLTGQAGPAGTGEAIRLEIDFQGHGGYAIARRRLALDLPDNYQFVFWVRGAAPPENLEFKLLDASGDNVWWAVRRDFAFPREWQRIVVKKRHLAFAWGPAGGGDIRHAAALEIAVSAGQGGRGVVDLAGFTFEPLPPPHPYHRRPVATASSSEPGHEPALALGGDDGGGAEAGREGNGNRGGAGGRPDAGGRHAGWHSRPEAAREQWLAIDFLERRELGGLVIDWDRDDFATRYAVLTSDDAAAWQEARTVERGGAGPGGERGGGSRSFLYLPETDARHVRLRLLASSRGRGYGIRAIGVLPVELSSSPNAFFVAVAKSSPRGSYPRAIGGEQSLWTLVGVDGGHDQGLLDEDGRLEAGSGGFSVEPFVLAGGELTGWSDVRTTPSLAAGYLPIPSVRWHRSGLACEVTALASGPVDSPVLYARYRLRNRTSAAMRPRLFLVLRPFQVDPPSQWLGKPGGAVEVRRIAFDGRAVELTVGAERARRSLLPLAPAPAAFGAMTFDEGSIVDLLRRGGVPAAAGVEDPFGYATAALAYDLRLAPGATGEVDVAIPLGSPPATPPAGTTAHWPAVEPGPGAPARLGQLLRQEAGGWRARLGGFAIRLPPPARPLVATLRTALAHILISRDGPALRPGTRSYARSWIRDGALISDALLRLGLAREVREFAGWYSGYQQAGGKVPCCVDARGADPVPENDSHGELLFLLASYYRFTGDRAFAESMWEHVEGAVAAIDALRQQRRTAVFRQPEKLAFFGLLPESISHEGYSAHPVHSYWDDFFALRGLADAADLARALGKDEPAARWAALRDELRSDLHASLRRTIAGRGLDYIPGSVELADFDPTSTAIAVSPGGELGNLPAAELRHTFERYYQDLERRRRQGDWISYTPYELRNAGVFVRLGWRERAQQLLAGMLADRRPPGWNQWPEVVWRDPRNPGFLGDLPHAWVAAEYIRAFLDLLAYERESDRALVLAAGVPAAWARDGGVAVEGLRTPYGSLDYTLTASRSSVRLRIAGGLRLPPGGLAVQWPFAGDVTVNGRPVRRATGGEGGGEVIVRELPADVRLRRRPG